MVTEPTDERGQLLLIGAVVIALVVIGSVVLLNGMKYTDTVGTSGTDGAVADSDRTVGMVESDLEGLVKRVGNDTSLLTFERELRENLTQLRRVYTGMTADRRSVYLNISVNGTASGGGILLNQSDQEDFVGDGGANEWNAVTDTTVVEPFDMTIDDWPSATGVGSPSQEVALYINATDDDGNLWSLKINDTREGPSSYTRKITVHNESGVQQVYTNDADDWFNDSGPYTIDVLNGRVTTNTTDSGPGLWTFANGVNEPYDITFDNEFPGGGQRAKGKYRLAADGSGTGAPASETTPLQVINPAFDIYYHQPEVQYTQTVFLRHDQEDDE